MITYNDIHEAKRHLAVSFGSFPFDIVGRFLYCNPTEIASSLEIGELI